jgi:hypothetical protein
MFFTRGSDDEPNYPDFCLISTPWMITMSQNSSVLQVVKSVSQALTPDKKN